MARAKAVSSREVVLEVLRAIAGAAIAEGRETVYFSKAEFIKTYWELRRKGRVPGVKIETLLRMLRRFAAEAEFVAYASMKGGKYIINTLKLPL